MRVADNSKGFGCCKYKKPPFPPPAPWLSPRFLPSDQLSTLDSARRSLHSNQGRLRGWWRCNQRRLRTSVFVSNPPIPRLNLLGETKRKLKRHQVLKESHILDS